MRHGSSVAGVADPGRGAERLSERLFGMGQDANQCVRIRRLKDVAWGPNVETGAGVPGYSGGLAACARVSFFFVAGVADPGRGAERLAERFFGMGQDANQCLSDLCREGCGLWATCENRGRRTRLQWRLGRRVVVSYLKS